MQKQCAASCMHFTFFEGFLSSKYNNDMCHRAGGKCLCGYVHASITTSSASKFPVHSNPCNLFQVGCYLQACSHTHVTERSVAGRVRHQGPISVQPRASGVAANLHLQAGSAAASGGPMEVIYGRWSVLDAHWSFRMSEF